jgi:hypothetical protein
MSSDLQVDRTRRFSAADVRRLVGITEPSADRIFGQARVVLGRDRADHCLELARLAPLSRRWVPPGPSRRLVAIH